jgi:hypothetical protein
MTATYPLEYCCAPKKTKEKDEARVEAGMEESSPSSDRNALESVDPDAWYIPFWTGSFVLCSQLFIYTVVIANVFFRNQLPPNADTWLRLAQVGTSSST